MISLWFFSPLSPYLYASANLHASFTDGIQTGLLRFILFYKNKLHIWQIVTLLCMVGKKCTVSVASWLSPDSVGGHGAGGCGGYSSQSSLLWMWGLGPSHQDPSLEPERWLLTVQFLCSDREDGRCAQTDPETNLRGHERGDWVHMWERQKQSSTSGAE